MFDVITRWIPLPDPVRFAGWCGGLKEPVLGPKLEHLGGTAGDLEVISFCDENFGTNYTMKLMCIIAKHDEEKTKGGLARFQYIEECNEAFANVCTLACRTLSLKGITVVTEDGTRYLDEE